MSTRVTLENVRLSFPHLFKARAVQAGDTPKFGAAFLVPKNHPSVPAIQAAVEAEKLAKWGANVPPSAKTTVYDGDNDPKYNTVQGNHGHYIVNASSTEDYPPMLVDNNLQKLINPAALYPGCYVNADIGFYGYDKGLSKGIAAGLNGVQFVQDGDRFDSRPTAEDMFKPVAGSPPAIATGVNDQFAASTPQQSAPLQSQPPVNPHGAPAQTAAATPEQPGVSPAGVPGFLG